MESSLFASDKRRVRHAQILLFCGVVALFDACPVPASGTALGPEAPPSYSDFRAIVQSYVDNRGMVDYKRLKADRSMLDAYVASLAVVNPKDYEEWPEKEKIAFWINAYNALTLRAVIDHYPIRSSALGSLLYPEKSIRQIPGVWDKLKFPVMGRELSLDDIEHSMLRVKFNEPRIHLALVCAAVGCPPLRNEPYSGAELDSQLDDQARRFLGNPDKFRLDRERGTVHLSPIFKWYGQDFVKRYGAGANFPGKVEAEKAVMNLLSPYLDSESRSFLEIRNPSIQYLDYDWSLNENGQG